jgi:hypothetical protein
MKTPKLERRIKMSAKMMLEQTKAMILDKLKGSKEDRWGHIKYTNSKNVTWRYKFQKTSIRLEQKGGGEWLRLVTIPSNKLDQKKLQRALIKVVQI